MLNASLKIDKSFAEKLGGVGSSCHYFSKIKHVMSVITSSC